MQGSSQAPTQDSTVFCAKLEEKMALQPRKGQFVQGVQQTADWQLLECLYKASNSTERADAGDAPCDCAPQVAWERYTSRKGAQ